MAGPSVSRRRDGFAARYHRCTTATHTTHARKHGIQAAASLPAAAGHRPGEMGSDRLRPVHRRAGGLAADRTHGRRCAVDAADDLPRGLPGRGRCAAAHRAHPGDDAPLPGRRAAGRPRRRGAGRAAHRPAHAPRPDAGAGPGALRLQPQFDQPDPAHRRHHRRTPGAAHRGAPRRRAGAAAHPGADRRPAAHRHRAGGCRARHAASAVRHRADGRRRPRQRPGTHGRTRRADRARAAGTGRAARLRSALRGAGRHAADAVCGRRRQPFAGHRQVDLGAGQGHGGPAAPEPLGAGRGGQHP